MIEANKNASSCEFCLLEFDQSLHKEMVLSPCSHKICSDCQSKLTDIFCPNCKIFIVEATYLEPLTPPESKSCVHCLVQ